MSFLVQICKVFLLLERRTDSMAEENGSCQQRRSNIDTLLSHTRAHARARARTLLFSYQMRLEDTLIPPPFVLCKRPAKRGTEKEFSCWNSRPNEAHSDGLILHPLTDASTVNSVFSGCFCGCHPEAVQKVHLCSLTAVRHGVMVSSRKKNVKLHQEQVRRHLLTARKCNIVSSFQCAHRQQPEFSSGRPPGPGMRSQL